MTETTDATEVLESFTPSPAVKTALFVVGGVAIGVFLGYAVAKVLEGERAGHYSVERPVVRETPVDVSEIEELVNATSDDLDEDNE